MWIKIIVLIIGTVLLTGCHFTHGISRGASVASIPDLLELQKRLESYPEIDVVEVKERDGSRPLTFTGIKSPDELFYLSYEGGEHVRGSLMFRRDYRGRITYSQSLLSYSPVPQELVDATWPVMKKIEKDLEERFGMREISESLRIIVVRVDHPERNAKEGSAVNAASPSR